MKVQRLRSPCQGVAKRIVLWNTGTASVSGINQREFSPSTSHQVLGDSSAQRGHSAYSPNASSTTTLSGPPGGFAALHTLAVRSRSRTLAALPQLQRCPDATQETSPKPCLPPGGSQGSSLQLPSRQHVPGPHKKYGKSSIPEPKASSK